MRKEESYLAFLTTGFQVGVTSHGSGHFLHRACKLLVSRRYRDEADMNTRTDYLISHGRFRSCIAVIHVAATIGIPVVPVVTEASTTTRVPLVVAAALAEARLVQIIVPQVALAACVTTNVTEVTSGTGNVGVCSIASEVLAAAALASARAKSLLLLAAVAEVDVVPRF